MAFDDVGREQGCNSGTLGWDWVQQLADQGGNVGGAGRRKGCIKSAAYLGLHFIHVSPIERQPKCGELVEEASKRPHVAAIRVGLRPPLLWRHIGRRSDLCIGHFGIQQLCYP